MCVRWEDVSASGCACVCVTCVRAPVCVWVRAAQTTWAASGRLAGMVVLGSSSNREHGDRN